MERGAASHCTRITHSQGKERRSQEERGEGFTPTYIQGSAKRRSPDLVSFVTSLAYHFCLALPSEFTQPGDHLLAEPCMRPQSCGLECQIKWRCGRGGEDGVCFFASKKAKDSLLRSFSRFSLWQISGNGAGRQKEGRSATGKFDTALPRPLSHFGHASSWGRWGARDTHLAGEVGAGAMHGSGEGSEDMFAKSICKQQFDQVVMQN